MSQPLRVLLVEDAEDDALLILRALRTGGFQPEHERVDSPEAMTAALGRGPWDIVLSDYAMPQFSGLDALTLLQKSGRDAPFIVVTGTIGEEEAVRCLHAGAADYLIKDRLDRLPSAVKGALTAAGERRRRLQVEAELKASEQRLRFALQTSHIGAWELNLADHTAYRTRLHDRIFGYETPLPVWTYETFLEHVLPEDRAEVDRKFRVATATHADWNFECRIRRADAEVRWIWAAGGHERDVEGTPARMSGIVQDVTVRKQAEEALRASEERFRELFEHSPDAIFVESAEGVVLDVNSAGCQLHEMTRGQLVGRHVLDLVPAAERESVARNFPKVVTGEITKVEGYSWTADGRAVPVEITCNQIVFSGQPAVLLHVRDITERRRAEEALDRERALLRTLIDLLPDYIYIKDTRNRFLLANRAVAQAMGAATPENLIGKSDHDFYSPDQAANFRSYEQEVLAGRAMFNMEELAPRPDGSQPFILSTKVPLKDAAGNIIGLVGIGRDITERKRASEAVQASQQMLQLVLDSVPQAVFWKDRDSRYLGCNAILVRHRGVENAEAIVGTTDRENSALTSEQAEYFIGKDREIMASDRPQFGIIEQTTRADGSTRWLETNKVPLHDTAGNVIGVLGTWQDITERKAADEEIRRLAAFPQMNPNPVLELTADGAIQFHNAAATAMAGELGFDHPVEMLPPGAAEIVRECLATGKSRVRLEMPCGKRIISWSFYPIPGRGIVHCYAGDVTEPRQLAEQLRQAQKMESVGQLAAGIAHDFNNLLTVIQGYSDILRMELADRPRSAAAVAEIAAAGERAAGLTRQLLLFSRKELAQRRQVDLNELTGNLTKLLGRVLGEDIALRLECRAGLPLVSADPGMIEQVITNLAVNARDAMPAGGRLEIATSVAELDEAHVSSNPEARPGSFVCLTVSDTGAGIAPEILPKIFEPFFTTKEIGKGTGLGLATVYGVVMQHQGVVEVTSQPGAGTRFHIYLPASSPADEAASRAAVPAAARGGSETILLVEDEAAMRPLLERILKQAGYTVLIASSGAAAQRMWPEHREKIDLLLTDLVMPEGLTGKQLAESLKRDKPGLRVIFMSGYSPEIRGGTPGIEEGLNYLQKPFSHTVLVQTVRRQLDYRG